MANRVRRYRKVPARYRLKLTVYMVGKPGKLEEIADGVCERMAAAGLPVAYREARWMNWEECSNPNWKPARPVEFGHPSTVTAERMRRGDPATPRKAAARG